jgi:hypothetical protein
MLDTADVLRNDIKPEEREAIISRLTDYSRQRHELRKNEEDVLNWNRDKLKRYIMRNYDGNELRIINEIDKMAMHNNKVYQEEYYVRDIVTHEPPYSVFQEPQKDVLYLGHWSGGWNINSRMAGGEAGALIYFALLDLGVIREVPIKDKRIEQLKKEKKR